VEAALKKKHGAARLRRWADEQAAGDPTGARFVRKDAAVLEAKADADLSRWAYTTAPTEFGNGGELVPLPEPETHHLAEHVREPADTLAHSASTQRMELAGEADALTLGLDAANSIKARDSVEKMLVHQAAAAHKLAMRLIAKAEHQLSQVQDWNPKAWSAHSVEAARLTHAAGKLMGAFNDTVLTVQRRRTGGKQVVKVIHQQVAAPAAGPSWRARSRAGARPGASVGGRSEIGPAPL
jgi:hypothetical protein